MPDNKFIGNPNAENQVPANPYSVESILALSRNTVFAPSKGLSRATLEEAGISFKDDKNRSKFGQINLGSDLSVVAKNYNDIKAKNQSWAEIAGRGLGNYAGKTLVNVAGGLGTMGTILGSAAMGVGKATANMFGADYEVGMTQLTGRLINGDVVKWTDKASKSVQDTFEIYRSSRFQERNLLSQLGTAEYWFGTVGDGLSFVTGAIITHYLTAGLGTALNAGSKALAGAAVTGQGVAKGMAATRAATQAFAKWGGRVDKLTAFRKIKGAIPGLDSIKNGAIRAAMSGGNAIDDATGLMYSGIGKVANNVGKAGGNLLKGIVTGSSYEASIQAHTFYNEAKEEAITERERALGRSLTADERADVINQVSKAANGVFGVNVALVTASNWMALGSSFFPVAQRIAKKNINFSGLMKGTRLVYSKGNYSSYLTRLKNLKADAKLAGNGAKARWLGLAIAGKQAKAYSYIAAKDFVAEGIIEELGQSSIHEGAMNFILSKYDPYSAYDGSSLVRSMMDQYGEDVGNLKNFDKKQWEDVLAGGILGLMGAPSIGGKYGVSWQGSVVQDIIDYHKDLSDIDSLGQNTLGKTQSILQDLMPYYTANQSYFDMEMQAEDGSDGHALRNAQSAKLTALVAMHYHAGTHNNLSKEIDTYFDNLSEEEINDMYNPDGTKSEDEVKKDIKAKKEKMLKQIKSRIKAFELAEGWNNSLQERDIVDAVAHNIAEMGDKAMRMSEIVQALPALLAKMQLSDNSQKFLAEVMGSDNPMALLKEAFLTTVIETKGEDTVADLGLDFDALTKQETEIVEEYKKAQEEADAEIKAAQEEIDKLAKEDSTPENKTKIKDLRGKINTLKKDGTERLQKAKQSVSNSSNTLQKTINKINKKFGSSISAETFADLREESKKVIIPASKASSSIKNPLRALDTYKKLAALKEELENSTDPEADNIIKMLQDYLKMSVSSEKMALETKMLKTKEGATTFLKERNEALETLLSLATDEANTTGDSDIYKLVSMQFMHKAAQFPGLENDESISIDELIRQVKSKLTDPLAGIETVAAKKRREQAGEEAYDPTYAQLQARYNAVMKDYREGNPDIDAMKELARDMKKALADPDISDTVKTLIQDLLSPLEAAISSLTGKPPSQIYDDDDEEASVGNAISSVFELSQIKFTEELLSLGNFNNFAAIKSALDNAAATIKRNLKNTELILEQLGEIDEGALDAAVTDLEAGVEDLFFYLNELDSGNLTALANKEEVEQLEKLLNSVMKAHAVLAISNSESEESQIEPNVTEAYIEALKITQGIIEDLLEAVEKSFNPNSNIFEDIKAALEQHGKAKSANEKSNLNLSFAFEEMEYETKDLNGAISEVPGLDGTQTTDAAGRNTTKVIAVYGTIKGKRMKIGYYFDPRRFRYKGQKINWKDVKAEPEKYLDLLYHMNSNFVYKAPDGTYKLKTLVKNKALNVNYFLDYINKLVDNFEAMQKEVGQSTKTDEELSIEVLEEMGLVYDPAASSQVLISSQNNAQENAGHVDEIKDKDSFVKTMLDVISKSMGSIDKMLSIDNAANLYAVRLGLTDGSAGLLYDRELSLRDFQNLDDATKQKYLEELWDQFTNNGTLDTSQSVLTGSVNFVNIGAIQDPAQEKQATDAIINSASNPKVLEAKVVDKTHLELITKDEVAKRKAAGQDVQLNEVTSDIVDKYFDLKGAAYNVDLTRPDKVTGEKLKVADRPKIDTIPADELFDYKGQKVAIIAATKNSDTKTRKTRRGYTSPVREIDRRYIYVQIDGGEWVQINMETGADPAYADMLDELLFKNSSIEDFDQEFEKRTDKLNSQQYVMLTKGDDNYNPGFTVRSLSRPVGTDKAKQKIQQSINESARVAMSDKAIDNDAARLNKAGKQSTEYLQPVAVTENGRRVGVMTTSLPVVVEGERHTAKVQADIAIYREVSEAKEDKEETADDQQREFDINDESLLAELERIANEYDNSTDPKKAALGGNVIAEFAMYKHAKASVESGQYDDKVLERFQKALDNHKKKIKAFYDEVYKDGQKKKGQVKKKARSNFFAKLKKLKTSSSEPLTMAKVLEETGATIEPTIAVSLSVFLNINGVQGKTEKKVRLVLNRASAAKHGIFWDAEKGMFLKSTTTYGTTITKSEPVEATYDDIMAAINSLLQETLDNEKNPIRVTIAKTINDAFPSPEKDANGKRVKSTGYQKVDGILKNFRVSNLTLEYEIEKTDDGQLDLSEMRLNYIPKVGMSLIPKDFNSDWDSKRKKDLEELGGAANIEESSWKDEGIKKAIKHLSRLLETDDFFMSKIKDISSVEEFYEYLKKIAKSNEYAYGYVDAIEKSDELSDSDGNITDYGLESLRYQFELYFAKKKNPGDESSGLDLFREQIYYKIKGASTWDAVPKASLKMLADYIRTNVVTNSELALEADDLELIKKFSKMLGRATAITTKLGEMELRPSATPPKKPRQSNSGKENKPPKKKGPSITLPSIESLTKVTDSLKNKPVRKLRDEAIFVEVKVEQVNDKELTKDEVIADARQSIMMQTDVLENITEKQLNKLREGVNDRPDDWTDEYMAAAQLYIKAFDNAYNKSAEHLENLIDKALKGQAPENTQEEAPESSQESAPSPKREKKEINPEDRARIYSTTTAEAVAQARQEIKDRLFEAFERSILSKYNGTIEPSVDTEDGALYTMLKDMYNSEYVSLRQFISFAHQFRGNEVTQEIYDILKEFLAYSTLELTPSKKDASLLSIPSQYNQMLRSNSFAFLGYEKNGTKELIDDLKALAVYKTYEEGNRKLVLTFAPVKIKDVGIDSKLRKSPKDFLKALSSKGMTIVDLYRDEPATQLVSEQLQESPKAIEDAIEMLRKILPDSIPIRNIQEIEETLRRDGVEAAGAFFRGVVYLSNNTTASTAYHEAFHAVFRVLLTDAERANLMREAELEYGTPSQKEIDKFLAGRPKAFRSYTLQQLRELVLEEKLADKFAEHMKANKKKARKRYPKQTWLRRLFRKLENIIAAIKPKKKYIDTMFSRIASGEFRGSKILREENSSPAFKLITIDKEDGTKETIGIELSRTIVDTVVARVLSQQGDLTNANRFSKRMIRQALLSIINDYQSPTMSRKLARLSIDKRNSILKTINILIAIESSMSSRGTSSSLEDAINQKLKARGLKKVEDEDIEFQNEDTDGLISDELQRFLKATYEISPEETLTTRVKMFLETIPFSRQDFADIDLKFNRVLPFREVFKALQVNLTNKPVYNIPYIIYVKSRSSSTMNAVYEELVKRAKKDYILKYGGTLDNADTKIRELFSQPGVNTFKELTDISPIVMSVSQGFYTSKATHIVAAFDPDSQNVAAYDSNQQTDVNDQFIKWSKKYIGAKNNKEDQLKAINILDGFYRNPDFLFGRNVKIGSAETMFITRNLELSATNLSNLSYGQRLELLAKLFDYVGMGVSEAYIEYSIMKQLEERGLFDEMDTKYGNLTEYAQAIENYEATDTDVEAIHQDLYNEEAIKAKKEVRGIFSYLRESTKKSSLPANKNAVREDSVYSGIYTKAGNTVEAFEGGSLTGRIRTIAASNAIFDETVGDSTIKNASGNNVQDKILPSFITEEVINMRNFKNSYLYDVYYVLLDPELNGDIDELYITIKEIFEKNGKILPTESVAKAYISALMSSPLVQSAISEYGGEVETEQDIDNILDIIAANYKKSSLFIADAIVTRKIDENKKASRDGKQQAVEFKSQDAASKYLTRLVHIADSAEKSENKSKETDFRKVQIGVNAEKSTNIFINRKYVETVEYVDDDGKVSISKQAIDIVLSLVRLEANRMRQFAYEYYDKGFDIVPIDNVTSVEAIQLMDEIKSRGLNRDEAVDEFLKEVLVNNKLKVNGKSNRAFNLFYFKNKTEYYNAAIGKPLNENFAQAVVQNMFEDMIEDLIKNKIITPTKDGYEGLALPNYYLTNNIVNMSNLADAMVFDFLVASEFSSVTYGDPGLLFKDFTDMVKRNGGLIAAGPNMGVGTTKIKVFKSANSKIDDHDKVRHGVKDTDYNGNQSTVDRSDAQSYGTIKFFREVYFKSKGVLNAESEMALQIIENGLESIFGNPNLSALQSQGILLSPKKLVYRDSFYYWKTSVAPLVRAETSIMKPSVTQELRRVAEEVLADPTTTQRDALNAVMQRLQELKNQGTVIFEAKPGRKKLHETLEQLEKEDINLYVADSAMKMLKEHVSEGFESPIQSESSIEFSNYYLREQLNTDGVKSKIIHGTQLQGLVWSEQIRTAAHDFLSSKATPQSMSKLYRHIIAERGRYGYNAKMAELFTDESLSQEKYDELLAALQRSLEASGSETDPFLIALFTSSTTSSDGTVNLVYDLNFSAVQAKYEAMFQSFLSADVFKHKVPGTKFYNTSDLGYTVGRKVYVDSEISKEEYERRVNSKRATSLDEYILNNANNVEDLQYVDKDTKEPCK